ncbi:MAG: hypothetical protein A2513_06340 [Sulfurimonas sp. RIFOXYD12_FULL_33_39]|uniref:DUF6602 domain-containing protein n=1 Tax=unclassified Sulfurimonas TaxID=2623549 RepID=UPI0008BD92C3|nr:MULTISPECIES: DUF6602 domain-containing protein [unclassified Sulfurimonas]OHE02310.1 MAG: hypothetical protein A3G74_07750 [Sulfurimonas sp. RIFCSPLOWO2_12_FULL_34_6]OHE10473.1 MAG: hypothetical protein A2513_06340 [Sulfurimonas sp. RIFOXYD12_FULL_33_39]OHE14932.1 MAG: hypothetical protein A2530_00530 [Sulfurimonas sp. RIFOXYD2_FULL_34_21]
MPIQQDFLAYHKSIGEELKTSEKRVRNLIGKSHWLTDGEHKESILRKVMNDFLPEIYRVGTGFVCYPSSTNNGEKNSGQIDILITSKFNPTLYKSGELHFVTPECANAIVEVKTKLSNGESIKSVLAKLSKEVKGIRENSGDRQKCWAGLFVYNKGSIREEEVLQILQEIANNDINSIINCVSIGENMFIRFWESGHPLANLGHDPIWHSYEIKKLSHAYFISNLVAYLSTSFTQNASDAWFPIHNTKERYRMYYAKLSETEVHNFI